MPPTPKQSSYLRDLMIEAGHAHPSYGSLRGSSKRLPHGPSMRERGDGNLDTWIQRLTVKQASEVIDYLKKK